MNKDKQRIAIASFLGELNPRVTEFGNLIASTGVTPEGEYWGTHGLHDYLNDLNAMHEAEETLVDSQAQDYIVYLAQATDAKQEFAVCEPVIMHWNIYHATATQRAEAFLKTVNRWEDGE
jgi:hypothetical protein